MSFCVEVLAVVLPPRVVETGIGASVVPATTAAVELCDDAFGETLTDPPPLGTVKEEMIVFVRALKTETIVFAVEAATETLA